MNAAGKVVVDKAPDGAKSPNLADAAVIAFAPDSASITIAQWAVLGLATAEPPPLPPDTRAAFDAACEAYRRRVA